MAIHNQEFDKAMSLRDPEFREGLEGFIATSTLETHPLLPPEKVRIGFPKSVILFLMTVIGRGYGLVSCSTCFYCASSDRTDPPLSMGAPAGGMNAATRAAVRYSIRQGHTPLAISNGFKGLLDDSVYELSWLGVDNWTVRGGSELGTNRTLPDMDLGAVASKFQEHHLQALLVIGGFEAFHSLLILYEGRKYYPAFHIPMVHIPATISNNVPMTELSLGSDTSLNALVDACDSIK